MIENMRGVLKLSIYPIDSTFEILACIKEMKSFLSREIEKMNL